MRSSPVLLLLLLTACAGEGPIEEPVAPEPSHPDTPALTGAELAQSPENVALVPSPVETQKALERAGVDAELSSLIERRTFDVENENPDNAAVRTGVVIADLLLTVRTASKEDLLRRLEETERGLAQLEAGKDILSILDDIQDRVRGDAVSRDELLKELDELSGAVIPELEFNGRDRVVPLIQAGSWLEGANLLSKAVKQADKPAAGDELLKQPAVVDYFLEYVKTEGADKAPEAVTAKLESALTTLKGVAEKTEPLTAEDIDLVIATTNDVLALL